LFFYYSALLSRVLPSFPTRRSSDLFRRSILPFSAIDGKMQRVVEQVTKSSKKGRYSIINYKPVKFKDENSIQVLHLEARHMDGRDRKSTRLNSSHVKMSYAVFCLKK